MNTQRMNLALTGLQWSLGIVIFAEAILVPAPEQHPWICHDSPARCFTDSAGIRRDRGAPSHAHPRWAIRGAWLLVAIFMLAIVVHLLHGMYEVGSLIIYSAAAWAVAIGKE